MMLKLPVKIAGPPEANAVRGENGFTLIEILITIAILGVLGTMAYMGMDAIHKHRLTAATMELYADLQKLRQDAMTRCNTPNILDGRGFGIRLVDEKSYVLFEFNDAPPNNDYSCTVGEEFQPVTRNLPSGVTMFIGSTGNPPANVVRIFDKMGIVRSANWGVVSGLNVVVQHPEVAQRRCVALDASRIREGLWNASTSNCD